ncbi:hypothetical protein Tco_0699881 [Tanacetum coccineum]
MDESELTIEQYIELLGKRARRRGETFDWQTATYVNMESEDLDSFTEYEGGFPAIVYNDAPASSHYVSSKPAVSIYNAIQSDINFSISFFDSEDEDYVAQFDGDSFNNKIIPIETLKPEPVNDHVKVNNKSSSENIVIKPTESVTFISKEITPVEFDKSLKTNHDNDPKPFEKNKFTSIIKVISRLSFREGMPIILLIINLYVPFGIPFNPKWYYKDGVCPCRGHDIALPARDQRHLWLQFCDPAYTEEIVHDFEDRLGTIYTQLVNRVQVLNFEGLPAGLRQELAVRMRIGSFTPYDVSRFKDTAYWSPDLLGIHMEFVVEFKKARSG